MSISFFLGRRPADMAGESRRTRILVLAAVFVLAGLLAWQAMLNRAKEILYAQDLVTALSRASEEHVDGLMRGIEVMLDDMVVASGRGEADDRLMELMRSRMRVVPEVRSAALISSDGVMRVGTAEGMADIDVRDREYFAVLRDDPRRTLHIAAPVNSRVVKGASMVAARPILGRNGEFRGVAAVAMDPTVFEEQLRSVVPQAGGRVTLIRDDGVILARVPEGEVWRGKSVAEGEVFTLLKGGVSGVTMGPSATDGTDRIVSYRRLSHWPLVIAVGIPSESVLSGWRRETLLIALILLAAGGAAFVLASIVDRRLTERRRMQRELRESEARYRRMTEHSPVGVFQADPDGTCRYAGRRWLELADRPPEDVLGRDWRTVVHPDDRGEVYAAWRSAQETGGEFQAELRLWRPDGALCWVRVHAAPLAAGGPDDLGGMVGTLEDITAAKVTERRLRLSEEKFAKAFHAGPDAMVISAAADGRYIELNDAFARLLGWPREEMVGRTALEMGVWPYPAERARLLELLSREGQVSDYEARLRRRGGGVFDVLIGVQRVVLEDEDCLLFVIRDVSDRKALEARTEALLAKLDSSNKELEQFAYVISHDLQEPLRMIAGYAQLIQRRYGGRLESDGDEFIGFLVDGAKRMQTMILDLLEYSRVERKGGGFGVVDAAEAAAEALSNLRIAVEDAGVGAEVQIGPLPNVVADRAQFVRLLQNLVGNALKYRDPSRPVRVNVAAEERAAEIIFSVTDNGIGIEGEYFERIFLVFQRLHTREQYEGTGIGLAVCKRIVERHGGHIRVESEPGRGSVFSFSLPHRQA